MVRNLKETYKYRALIHALVVRHLSIRYRGSALGFLWSFLNPLCLMLVYTMVFHYYIRFNQVQNYTIFLFCGLLPWIWSSSAISEGTSSIVGGGHLITKSMFPAHILPLVAVLTTLINFLLSLPLLFIFMVMDGVELQVAMLSLPFIIIIQLAFLYGISLMLSSANVLYRDVQHLIANILSLLFFLCPIVYPLSSVPEAFRFTVDLNPFALFIATYHRIILEGAWPSLTSLLILSVWSGAALVVGNMLFDNWREEFAEML